MLLTVAVVALMATMVMATLTDAEAQATRQPPAQNAPAEGFPASEPQLDELLAEHRRAVFGH